MDPVSPGPLSAAELAALCAVRAGAQVAVEQFSRLSTLEFTAKDGDGKVPAANLVSQADVLVERAVREVLATLRPADGFEGEEGTISPTRPGAMRWVLDPIDGTLNFAYGRPEFAVSLVGLGETGPVCAVVAQPLTGEVYRAGAGRGAYLNDRRLRVEDHSVLSNAVVEMGAGRGAIRDLLGSVVGTIFPAVRDIRREGCAALAICAVASGRADAYYGPGLRIWDRAAALLIATEAGARCENLHGQEPDDEMTLVSVPGIFEGFRDLVTAATRPATSEPSPREGRG